MSQAETKLIEIGKALESSETPHRLPVPVVGTHAASSTLLILVGLLFLCVGSCVSMIGFGWIPIDMGQAHIPMQILVLVGLVFALPGLVLLVRGRKNQKDRSRIRDLQTRLPEQAWAWDGNWDGRVLLDRNLSSLRTSIIGVLFLFCFVGVFHYVGFVGGRAPELFRYASILVDLGFVIAVGFLARTVLRLQKHGRGRIELSEMPIRPGKSCRLQFSLGSELSLFDALLVDLAFVEERVVETGSGNHRSRHLMAETRLVERVEIPLAGITNGLQRTLDLSLCLPIDCPITQLSSHPSRSWQIGIQLQTLGLDYKGRFLLPVYGFSAPAPNPRATPSPAPELTTSL
jgi:hypothetical protein